MRILLRDSRDRDSKDRDIKVANNKADNKILDLVVWTTTKEIMELGRTNHHQIPGRMVRLLEIAVGRICQEHRETRTSVVTDGRRSRVHDKPSPSRRPIVDDSRRIEKRTVRLGILSLAEDSPQR
jgi:hypothetical protein